MTQEAPLDDLWKKVGRESEAGKLLFKLFKVPNKPLVYYPPVTTKKAPLPFETKRTVSAPKPIVDYPALKPKPGKKLHAIDLISRRKPRSAIEEETKVAPRPKYPGRPGVDREEMKTQLQDKFQFSTGALPKQVMMPATEAIPGEVRARRREKPKPKVEPEADSLESMFDQIVKEIEERQTFLQEMEELGECTEEVEARIKAEIVERISDLQKIRELM
jgi:hypothetical protein